MKRYFLILILTLSVYTLCDAQTEAKSPLDFRYRVGMRLGINLSDMGFSHEPVDRYSHTLQPLPMAGLFFGVRLGESPLSIMPEVTFIQRGVKLNWLDVDYRMQASYLDLRLPLTYSFRLPEKAFAPYLMVAPTLGLALGGIIDYTADDYPNSVHRSVTKADLSGTDFGLLIGAGVDWLTHIINHPFLFSLEAGYNFGLINTFAYREQFDNINEGGNTPSIIANPFFGAELWHNERHNRGIEVALRVSIPFGCIIQDTMEDESKLLANYMPPPPPDTVHDTITTIDTVIITLQPQTDTVMSREYVIKDCYSIAEMFSFITLGIDISDKRICLFNINFDFDSYNLRPESLPPLNELAMMMTAVPDIKINVYGHTDSIGTNEYNQRLSENRAKSVMNYIVSRGVNPARIAFEGFGEEYPIESNETAEGRFRNRRVEFDIILPFNDKKEKK